MTTLDVRDQAGAETVADERAATVEGRWSIGIVVSLYFVAHKRGPQPEPTDAIKAVNLGLIELGNPWRVTERGKAILAEHGWQ